MDSVPRPPGRDFTIFFSWAISRASHSLSSVHLHSGSKLNLEGMISAYQSIINETTYSTPGQSSAQSKPKIRTLVMNVETTFNGSPNIFDITRHVCIYNII